MRTPAGRSIVAWLLAAATALPAAAGEEPLEQPTPEAKALVAKVAALQQGPRHHAGEPMKVPLRVVVGGKEGAAAVAVDLVLIMEAGGRGMRFEKPAEGDAARIGGIAQHPARLSVDMLVAGFLPYSWDTWKGEVGEGGVLKASIREKDRWALGMEVSFDAAGLPSSVWNLLAGEDGTLQRAAHVRTRWEPAGPRHRLIQATHEQHGKIIADCRYEWGPPEELLPRRWTVLVNDRVTRFARKGHEAPVPADLGEMAYYLDPQPRRFLDGLKALGDALLAPPPPKPDQGDLKVVMLAAILRAEPERIDSIIEELAKAGPGPGRVLVRAVALAADANLEKSLDFIKPLLHESVQGECDRLRKGLPRPLESAIPMNDVHRGAAALDRCWFLYIASGDPAAIRPIVGALRGLDMEFPANLVGSAARWSLTSNARQLPGVRECLERDLAEVPPELLPHLKQVLEKAGKPDEPDEPEETPPEPAPPPPGPK